MFSRLCGLSRRLVLIGNKKISSFGGRDLNYGGRRGVNKMLNSKAKQRGQHRKWRKLREHIYEISDRAFQNTDQAFEHFHVPSDQFIDSRQTSGKIKTAFCRVWIEETERLIRQKPEDVDFCKVVCVLCPTELWSSQIIVFYDKEYYDSFWDRSNEYQQWRKCETNRSLLAERNIKTNLPELLIRETIREEEDIFCSDLWFYGEWPTAHNR